MKLFNRIHIPLCLILIIACADEKKQSEEPFSGSTTITLSLGTEVEEGNSVTGSVEINSNLPLIQLRPEDLQVEISDAEILRVEPAAPFEFENRSNETNRTKIVFDKLDVFGLSPGNSDISIRLGEILSNTVNVTVRAPAPEPVFVDLVLSAMSREAPIGESFQVIAFGVTANDQRIDISERVSWSSEPPDVASVSVDGLVTIRSTGRSEITASMADLTARIRVGSPCEYPVYDERMALNSITPPFAWRDAYTATGEIIDYSFREIFCDPSRSPRTIAIILGAGWCSACTTLTVNVLNPIAELLEDEGMQILYIEGENGAYQPATSQYAFRHIDRLIGEGPGIRVGDVKTEFEADASSRTAAHEFFRTQAAGTFPGAWVIRTSDMRVIADQVTSEYWLPFLAIAQDPNADWSSPPAPMAPPFESNCEEGDEEESEPNDTSLRPARLTEGVHRGAICAPGPDFYEIAESGTWRATLRFTHNNGDLDLFVWNKTANEILTDTDGIRIGSWGQSDTEIFEGEGNALIMVTGYGGASNTYTLTLEITE